MPLQPPAEFKPQFPETRSVEDVPARITAASNNRQVLARIKKGERFCFEGTWGTAMAFYSWIKKQVNLQFSVQDYASSRINREKVASLTERLFIHIHNHHPDLAKAPGNPWLREFYPSQPEFLLRFTDYLGMNGARQWYEKGILFPGLSHKVHPFYGTYFPTRTEHLELFDRWLQTQKFSGPAIDMGTGCGTLSFYMHKHGIQNIAATDINSNALYSLSEDLKRLRAEKAAKPLYSSFFDKLPGNDGDLMVFNPPWLPQQSHTVIDKAMYYDEDFFQTFFSQAHQRLSSNCQLVILFSNFARVAGITNEHPIEEEVASNQRFSLQEKLSLKIQQKASPRKDWLSQIRMHEEAELWVLQKIS